MGGGDGRPAGRGGWAADIRLEAVVGGVALVALIWVCFRLFRPFMAPLVWAVAIATALRAPYARLLAASRGRANLSAALSVVGVSLAIVLPVVLIVLVLFGEVNRWYSSFRQHLSAGFDPLATLQRNPLYGRIQGWLLPWLERAGVEIDLRQALLSVADSAQRVLVTFLGSFAAGFGTLMVDFALMLVAMFFLFRDGAQLGAWIERLSPLGDENNRRIAARFGDVTAATLLGTLATGAAQGSVGGLLFLILGVPNFVLWGTVMAIMSFVPVVGGAVVWVPACLWLWSIGSPIKAVVLAVLCAVVVGSVDNVVKPIVMGPRAGLHPGIVLFSVFGGLQLWGLTGVVLGPMLVTLLLVFAQIYRERYADQLAQVPEPPGDEA